ncbi:MAG: 1,4-dihydroxy-6-naphthoate synthase [Acidobacteriota bacterium]
MPPLSFAFSTCPNDTFAFHALVHGLVPGPPIVPHMDDIEALNLRAATPAAQVTKISLAAYLHQRDRFALLRSGGAAGFGVGPIIIARESRAVGGRVAIPGETTTAALLLRMLGKFDTVAMRFDQVEDAVLRGDADCGVLIHEGRFTYQQKGLVLLRDLGEYWEQRMQCALPLAAIAIRRDLLSQAPEIDAAIRASVEYAFAHPLASADYVREHAQEMDPTVAQRHISLYANQYTLALDEAAIQRFITFAEEQGICPASTHAVFA